MRCNNALCYCENDNDTKNNCCSCCTAGKLCCGFLDWKKTMLLIAFLDVISVSIDAYGTSGSTLGEVETRMGISHFFNMTIQETDGEIYGYYSIYIVGIALLILRLLTILSLILGAINYRPCCVLIWAISAPVGWVIFFTMQVVLLERYSGENNQSSKLWSIWNAKGMFSINTTGEEMSRKIDKWESDFGGFGQPCVNILVTSILSFIITVFSTFYGIIFYRKQINNEIR